MRDCDIPCEREFTFHFKSKTINEAFDFGTSEAVDTYQSEDHPEVGSILACIDILVEKVGRHPVFPFWITVAIDPPDDDIYCHVLRNNLDGNLYKYLDDVLGFKRFHSRAFRDFYWWIEEEEE